MASNPYKHLFIAKVERVKVGDETAEVRLIVFRDMDNVHVNEGDEFITLQTKVNPFEEAPDAQ